MRPQQVERRKVPRWTLGDRLKRSLRHAGMKAEDMAACLDVSRGTVSRWMNDEGAPPRPVYLREWARLCDVPYDWLSGADTQASQRLRRRDDAFESMLDNARREFELFLSHP